MFITINTGDRLLKTIDSKKTFYIINLDNCFPVHLWDLKYQEGVEYYAYETISNVNGILISKLIKDKYIEDFQTLDMLSVSLINGILL